MPFKEKDIVEKQNIGNRKKELSKSKGRTFRGEKKDFQSPKEQITQSWSSNESLGSLGGAKRFGAPHVCAWTCRAGVCQSLQRCNKGSSFKVPTQLSTELVLRNRLGLQKNVSPERPWAALPDPHCQPELPGGAIPLQGA